MKLILLVFLFEISGNKSNGDFLTLFRFQIKISAKFSNDEQL